MTPSVSSRGCDSEIALLLCHLPMRDRDRPGRVPVLRNRRRAQRRSLRLCGRLLVDWLLCAYSFLELGCPRTIGQYRKGMGTWHLSSRQMAATELLLEDIIPFCRSQAGPALVRGRGIGSLHAMCDLLANNSSAPDRIAHDMDRRATLATEATAERMSERLPEICAECDTTGLLDGSLLHLFPHQDLLPNKLLNPLTFRGVVTW